MTKMVRHIATMLLKAYLIAFGILGHKLFLSIKYRKLQNIAAKIHIINEKVPLPTMNTATE